MLDENKTTHQTALFKYPDIQVASLLSFLFIAVSIFLCASLIKRGLDLQHDMLTALSISYEQRILVEGISQKFSFLARNLGQSTVDNDLLQNIQSDIISSYQEVRSNQLTLYKILDNNNRIIDILNMEQLFQDISNSFKKTEYFLKKLDDRIYEIKNLNIYFSSSINYHVNPIDMMTSSDGSLLKEINNFNKLINQITQQQNNLLYSLYGILFILLLITLWATWYFLLRPLSKKLAESYIEIQQKNNHLSKIAYYDSLTQLLNRSAFVIKMGELEKKESIGRQVALVLIDVDNLKIINDNYGHQIGDLILKKFSFYLNKQLSQEEHAYRLGGDEFAIILNNIHSFKQLKERMQTLSQGLKNKVCLVDQGITVNHSMGVAWGNKSGHTFDELFSAADMALYHVKNNGKQNIAYYNTISDLSIAEVLLLEQELYQAIKNKEFIVHYQPIIDLRNGNLVKLEALMRWQHPKHGLLLPQKWAHAAERLSLMSTISLQIFDRVEQDLCNWRRQELPFVPVNVNINEALLLSGRALDHLKAIGERSGLDSAYIGIEITESVMLDRSISTAKTQLERFTEAGIRIALDDFGTGFANLAHLNRIPFDAIKVDCSFTSNIIEDDSMRHIIESLINLAAKLKKELICEGVENTEIRDELLKMGGIYSQGFLHSKAVSSQNIVQLLIANQDS